MCWNKETSFITLILGTIFNIILVKLYPTKEIKVIALIWQFVLLMQLFEGLSWISKENEYKNLSKFSTISAFFSNILQPVAVCIGALILVKSFGIKAILSILIISYLIYCYVMFRNFNFSKDLYYDSDNCKHLKLYWWDKDKNKKFKNLFIFYIILVIFGYLCFPRKSLGVLLILYIIFTLLLSKNLYPCSTGSLWCWFAAFAPIYTVLCLKIINY